MSTENHFDARQDSMSKRWHYTCRTGLEIWSVGFCDQDGGHENEDGARACYRRYLVENARFNLKLPNPGTCVHADCGKPAEKAAVANGCNYPLCKEHLNTKGLDAVFPQVGTIVSS